MRIPEQSTAALKSLNESYSTLDNLLASSKSLIGTLVSSQKSDTWYLETAFWILVYTIAWLVFRRIFYGPIRYIFYLPTKWTLQFIYSIVNVVIGIFTGTVLSSGPKSLSVSKAVSSSVTTTIIQSSATVRGSTAKRDMSASHVPSGAGNKDDPRPGEDLSEDVGRMAEETLQQEQEQGSGQGEQETAASGSGAGQASDPGTGGPTVLRPRREDEEPNPKKRMWEEPPAPKKEERMTFDLNE